MFKETAELWQQLAELVPVIQSGTDDSTATASKLSALLQNSDLRPEIAASWQRCCNYGIQPQSFSKKETVKNDLDQKKEQNRELLSIARLIMQQLYEFIQNSGSVVLLTDSQGMILECVGDNGFLELIDIARPGISWSEKDLGTNGVGTALFLDRPIQIIGTEHFFQSNHHFTCSGAPVKDEKGNTIGCLDISSRVEHVHQHTLGMVAAGARAITQQLALTRNIARIESYNSRMDTLYEVIPAGLIAINEKLEIVKYNNQALRILGIENQIDLSRLKISSIITAGIDFENYLQSGDVKIVDSEFNLQICHPRSKISRHSKIIMSIVTIPTAEALKRHDVEDGLFLIFKNSAQVFNTVNKLSGQYARLTFDNLIGTNHKFMQAMELAKIAGQSSSGVLLLGESGTGKELFAQSIHNYGNRKQHPFIAVNCGALPRDLVQSELFGYEGGAFTGASKNGQPGKFELANGGTIFLDEIGDMPLDAQVNLLRVLQNREVVRIGGKMPVKVDVRIIAATNHDLLEMVQRNLFREDLYYRLNILTVNIPPLRERKSDLPLLISYLIDKIAVSMQKKVTGTDKSVLEYLDKYDFPGNIRELENMVERAINICQGTTLQIVDFPSLIQNSNKPVAIDSKAVKARPFDLKQGEKDNIIKVLSETRGNIRESSQHLGISRCTLYEKLRKYEIDIHSFR